MNQNLISSIIAKQNVREQLNKEIEELKNQLSKDDKEELKKQLCPNLDDLKGKYFTKRK